MDQRKRNRLGSISLVAAIGETDLAGPCQSGGLIERILKAAQ